jgi:hypothetical protein
VAEQTPMERAHGNGMRRAVAFLKHRLTPEALAPAGRGAGDTVVATLKLYLREWGKVYDEGTRMADLTATERVILQIRMDTLLQMANELEKLDPAGMTVEGSVAST